VSAIALLCLVLLCTPVHDWLQSCGSPGRLAIHSCERMFCALLIFVNTSSLPWEVKRLIWSCGSPSGRLQGSIILGPPTHSCENIPLAFELYVIEISVVASMPTYRDSRLCVNLIDVTAQHWAVVASSLTYSWHDLATPWSLVALQANFEYTAHWWVVLALIVALYCSSLSSCNFHVNLYIAILATPIILWDLASYRAVWDQTCLNIILLVDISTYSGKDDTGLYYTAHHL
jgi:hypothetical protein